MCVYIYECIHVSGAQAHFRKRKKICGILDWTNIYFMLISFWYNNSSVQMAAKIN